MTTDQIYKVRLGDLTTNTYTDTGIVYVITHDKHKMVGGSWKCDVTPLDATTRLFVETGHYGDLTVVRDFMGLSRDRRYSLTLRRFQPKTCDKESEPEWVAETYTNYLDHVITHYIRVLQDSRWIQNAPQILECIPVKL
jgi:hypothetical protein